MSRDTNPHSDRMLVRVLSGAEQKRAKRFENGTDEPVKHTDGGASLRNARFTGVKNGGDCTEKGVSSPP